MRLTQIIFMSLLYGFSINLQAQQEPPQQEPPQQAQAELTQAQADGKVLYTAKGCLACHGLDGNKPLTPTYPTVAGQNAEYTFNQLRDFKASARNSGQAAIMVGIVAALSEDEMRMIALHLSDTKTAVKAETTAEAQADAPAPATTNTLYFDKACIACHGANGNAPVMNAYPKIAGQTELYLLAQMKDIKSGARNNSHAVAMTNIMNTVSDEEMASLAKWLSQQSQ